MVSNLAKALAPGRARKRRRDAEIKASGSPFYPYVVPVLAAGATDTLVVITQFPQSEKYAPLDFIEILNVDSVNLEMGINSDAPIFIPAGLIKVIDNIPAILVVKVKNLDSTTATTLGSVRINLKRQPMSADIAARQLG